MHNGFFKHLHSSSLGCLREWNTSLIEKDKALPFLCVLNNLVYLNIVYRFTLDPLEISSMFKPDKSVIQKY